MGIVDMRIRVVPLIMIQIRRYLHRRIRKFLKTFIEDFQARKTEIATYLGRFGLLKLDTSQAILCWQVHAEISWGDAVRIYNI